MSALNHSLCLLKHDARNLNVTVCRLIECGSDDFCVYCAAHIGNFLRSLVDEQHHEISLRMVCRNSIGNVFHKDSLTSLWLCHDECALSLTNRREEVNDACAWVCGGTVASEVELLFWEERGEMFERDAVADFLRLTSINLSYCAECEIFLSVMWRTYEAVNHVACLETVFLYLLWRNVYIVR